MNPSEWVLGTLGARHLDVPAAELQQAFGQLSLADEENGPRDKHGRFPASASSHDPLDPPLERLRRELGVEPPRWRGARFAVALTHDVDIPWRWTRLGVKLAVGRRDLRGLAGLPLHKLRRTDPNWSFKRVLDLERKHGARSTFFLMTGFGHRADPEPYGHLLPRLVEALGGAEIGLHGSYRAADDPSRLIEEKAALERLAGPVSGHRFHYLRLNLTAAEAAGFRYDSTLGFSDAVGFRAGIAHPFRPWGTRLVEIPLAAMDVTLGERRYLGLSAREAEPHLMRLLDWATEHGGGFAVLWHTDRFDPWTARGWDRLYERVLAGIGERGGVCLSAGELAEEADAWLP